MKKITSAKAISNPFQHKIYTLWLGNRHYMTIITPKAGTGYHVTLIGAGGFAAITTRKVALQMLKDFRKP